MNHRLEYRKCRQVDYKERNSGEKVNTIVGQRQALNNWLRQFTTIIDLRKKQFKIQESLLGIFKWGEFKSLPKINYILVFKASFVKCESCSIEEHKNNPFSYYQVSLVYNSHHRIIVHETKNKTDAFKLARELSLGLNARIKDSASDSRKAVWIS